MIEKILKRLPLLDVKPKGWLLKQLIAQKDGLTGNVRFLFKDLSENSAWLFGDGECWERGPYYLDGLLPLAYLTEDETLLKESSKWIECIFKSQKSNGSFGPEKNPDYWPRMVVTKIMPQYYEATGDSRAIEFLKKYYDYMEKQLDIQPLYNWANARGFEELIGIEFLYEQTKDEKLISLAKKILTQTIDWVALFKNFKYLKPSKDYMPSLKFNLAKAAFYAGDFLRNTFSKKAKPLTRERIVKRNNHPFNLFYHITHGVNIAMALKHPALAAAFLDDESLMAAAKQGLETILKHHGTATGLYSCDEHLSGYEPTQGIELCTVVEAMFSAEVLFERTGDSYWADYLELLSYNALPATFTADMCAHQYVQQANQISATVAKRNWYDSYNKANIFGLKPNYACCLSNMHQGFPKFCENLAFFDSDGITLLAPLPMKVETTLSGKKVSFEVISDYPFNKIAQVKILEGDFELKIRKPANCKILKIDGKKFNGEFAVLTCSGGQTKNIELELIATSKINSDSSASIYFGPLLMALDIKNEVKFKDEKNRFSDREFFPKSDWQYGLIENEIENGTVEFEKNDEELPFSKHLVKYKIKAVKVNWGVKHNSADKVQNSKLIASNKIDKVPNCAVDEKLFKESNCKEIYKNNKDKNGENHIETEYVTLVPYGATVLRIAQFPLCKL